VVVHHFVIPQFDTHVFPTGFRCRSSGHRCFLCGRFGFTHQVTVSVPGSIFEFFFLLAWLVLDCLQLQIWSIFLWLRFFHWIASLFRRKWGFWPTCGCVGQKWKIEFSQSLVVTMWCASARPFAAARPWGGTIPWALRFLVVREIDCGN